MIDYVKEKAASRALLQVRISGRQTWISVFKKSGNLPMTANSQGKHILAGADRLLGAKTAYEATNAVVINFNNRDLSKDLKAAKGAWEEC